MKRRKNKSCLKDLYTKDIKGIPKDCNLDIFKEKEFISKLNSTSYLVYSKQKSLVNLICIKNGIVNLDKKEYIINNNIITLRDNCKANLENHILSHHRTIDLEVDYQFNTIGIDLKEILQLSKQETEEFIEFAKKKLNTSSTQLKLVDIKRKFHLHNISKHQSLLQKIKSIVLAVITVFSLLILFYFIIKLTLKLMKTRNKPGKEVQIRVNMANVDKKSSLQSLNMESPPEAEKDKTISLTSDYLSLIHI